MNTVKSLLFVWHDFAFFVLIIHILGALKFIDSKLIYTLTVAYWLKCPIKS